MHLHHLYLLAHAIGDFATAISKPSQPPRFGGIPASAEITSLGGVQTTVGDFHVVLL